MFQSLFQWIPVLYSIGFLIIYGFVDVSILISVDSGLIQIQKDTKSLRHLGFNPYFSGFRSYTIPFSNCRYFFCMFQSLFQWIPVLYFKIDISSCGYLACFNPYFSGFRSYTIPEDYRYSLICLVSILISVDSGLIRRSSPVIGFSRKAFQSLFQWIPVLYAPASAFNLSISSCFNPYFSGFRSYTIFLAMSSPPNS